VIDYSYLVTNTGGSTLVSISVADDVPLNMSNAVTTDCSSALAMLAPGASTTCTGSYTTDTADQTNGSVVDDAVASANDFNFGDSFNSAPSSKTVTFTGP
jgi:hypothetical protein